MPGIPDVVGTRIVERAEGVPLYALETVRSLINRGALVAQGGHYALVGEVSDLDIPASLTSLISARLDGLDADERLLAMTALADRSPGALRDEIAGCRDELEDLTGRPVELFAYPFSHHDPAVRDAVAAAGYAAAFTFLNGRDGAGLDRHRLPRLTMGVHQSAARLTYHLARSPGSWPDHQLDRVTGDGS